MQCLGKASGGERMIDAQYVAAGTQVSNTPEEVFA